jgi:transcriptional regulator with XRE-family HTH domain
MPIEKVSFRREKSKSIKNVYLLDNHNCDDVRCKGDKPMSRVNPFVLKTERNRKGLSQQQLADLAKIDKQTIFRLEAGKQSNARGGTLKALARALGIDTEELTRETVNRKTTNDDAAVRKISQHGFGLSVQADNFLYLISQRYFVQRWQVMELAPLLFCWAAEMSLRARKERLVKLEQTYETAHAIENEVLHLPSLNFNAVEKWIAAEASSIESNDIFGMFFSEDDFDGESVEGGFDHDNNPFAVFLSKLTDDISETAEFTGFSPIDYPIYRVCMEDVKRMVEGDEELAEHILTAVVRLREMPKELQEFSFASKPQERVAWVRKQVEEYTERFNKRLQKKREGAPT